MPSWQGFSSSRRFWRPPPPPKSVRPGVHRRRASQSYSAERQRDVSTSRTRRGRLRRAPGCGRPSATAWQ